eukprot:scaffold20950_cov151-Isochrysis_galbana.AAC.8
MQMHAPHAPPSPRRGGGGPEAPSDPYSRRAHAHAPSTKSRAQHAMGAPAAAAVQPPTAVCVV